MRRLILASIPVVVLSACGGGSGPIPLSQLADEVASAECAAEARCNEISDQAACRQAFPVDISQLEADVATGKVIYDANAAGACLHALAALSCSRSALLGGVDGDACDRTFTGTLSAGSPCFSSSECVSGSCEIGICDPSVTCCAGQCAAQDVVAGIGQPCGTGTTTCQDGAYCQFTGGTAVCTAKAAAGQPCQGFGECASGLWCRTQTLGVGTGTCARLPATGQPCDEQNLPCDSIGDGCGPGGVCVPRVGAGGPCAGDGNCRSDTTCDLVTGKCKARGGVGTACTDEETCLTWLVCTNGACAARAPEPVCP
jgi:hypothetical protein